MTQFTPDQLWHRGLMTREEYHAETGRYPAEGEPELVAHLGQAGFGVPDPEGGEWLSDAHDTPEQAEEAAREELQRRREAADRAIGRCEHGALAAYCTALHEAQERLSASEYDTPEHAEALDAVSKATAAHATSRRTERQEDRIHPRSPSGWEDGQERLSDAWSLPVREGLLPELRETDVAAIGALLDGSLAGWGEDMELAAALWRHACMAAQGHELEDDQVVRYARRAVAAAVEALYYGELPS